MINTLLFDFGDVFLNLDKEATSRELKKLRLGSFNRNLEMLNNTYEKGEISSKSFINHYQTLLPHASRQEIINAWNAILLDFPVPRIEFIENLALSKNYQLLLLSNTNEIHINWVEKNIAHFNRFKSCFEKFYLSYEIGMRKPDVEVFDFVLNDNDIRPENMLYIDDTKTHTDSAKKLGIQIWNLDPKTEDITQLFNKYPQLL